MINEKTNKLSYCKTCNILRPPRAYHCPDCGICVEVHDHHCPWVGTCVGYRNHRYFVLFLFWTGTHALVTFIICLSLFLGNPSTNMDDPVLMIAKAIIVYTGCIALTLYGFLWYQLCLVVKNRSSNESLREKWNGNVSNLARASVYKENSSCV